MSDANRIAAYITQLQHENAEHAAALRELRDALHEIASVFAQIDEARSHILQDPAGYAARIRRLLAETS